MTKKAEAVFEDALALPKRQRQELAERLFDSLPRESQDEIESAWITEIERRIKEVDEGKVKVIPGAKVMSELKARMRQ